MTHREIAPLSLLPPSTLLPRNKFWLDFAVIAFGGVIWAFLFWLLLHRFPNGAAHNAFLAFFHFMLVGTPVMLMAAYYERHRMERDDWQRHATAIYMFTRRPPEKFRYVFLVSPKTFSEHFSINAKTDDGEDVLVARYPEGQPGERFVPELLAHVLRQLPEERRRLACPTELRAPASNVKALLESEGRDCPVYELIVQEQPISFIGQIPSGIN